MRMNVQVFGWNSEPTLFGTIEREFVPTPGSEIEVGAFQRPPIRFRVLEVNFGCPSLVSLQVRENIGHFDVAKLCSFHFCVPKPT
jgi:hypothetical protein